MLIVIFSSIETINFAEYNKKVKVLEYTEEEYEKYLKGIIIK